MDLQFVTLTAGVSERAVKNGQARKVINMSLGGGTKSRTEESGLNNLYNSGTLLDRVGRQRG
jgi:hypothetical protein